MRKNIVQGFWIGNTLSNIEKMSINSFIKNGYEYHLYIYDNVDGIPDGTIIKDGNEILSSDEIYTYQNNEHGKSSISAFSNIFRYTLLYKKGGYWVDTDMICRKFIDCNDDFLFTTEPKAENYEIEKINAGIIKAPQGSEQMKYGMELCKKLKEDVLSGKLKWGMGPKTVKLIVEKFNLQQYVKSWFFSNSCSCHHWKSILESDYKINIEEYGLNAKPFVHLEDLPDGNYCVHLWNQFWIRDNLDKNGEYNKDSIFEQFKTLYL